jgi:hypothetical protein
MINFLIVKDTKIQNVEDIHLNLVAIRLKKIDISNLAVLRKSIFSQVLV